MKRILLTTFVSVILSGFAYAQEKLTGSVKDAAGDPLPGATIVLKGSSSYAISDTEGNFEFTPPKEFPFTLQVNLVGYKQQEVEIYELTGEPTDVTLQIENVLDEIVVIGYGEQKRKDITGSVASVSPELKAQPVASVERLLQGAVAGAVVTQTSGQPGGGVSVQIRGNNSITAGSEPLYVIDGFPINNDYDLNDAGVTNGPKINPLSSINTTDIENIDVLKDASATAIYGSRGANGVVIITTKRARKNESQISYDGYYGVQEVVRTIPVMNAAQWWALRTDAARNSGKLGTLKTNNTNAINSAIANNYVLDTAGTGTDWQKAAFRQAPIQNHSLSILTGNEKTSIAFSGNYFKQEGILVNTGFTRASARFNIDHEYNKRLRFITFLTASIVKADVAPDAIIPALLQTPPSLPIYNNNGDYVIKSTFESSLQNPINSLYNQLNNSKTNRFLGNIAAEYELAEGLVAKVLFGADVVDNKQSRYLPNSTAEGQSFNGLGTIGAVFTTNWLNENTLSYTKQINGVHNINAIIGATAQASKTNGSIAESNGFAFDQLTVNSLGDGNTARIAKSFTSAWQLASFLGRVNYGFGEKYLATVTVRADGSSRFGDNNKWGIFPSVALGWNITEEDFFTVDQIDALKLRVSAGITGNQAIPPYSSVARLSPYRYNFSNTTTIGYAPSSASNPNLGWEKTAQVDIGIDVGLLNNRITLVADVYSKTTSDLLLNAPVSGTSGLAIPTGGQTSTIYQNIGKVENKGIELAINTQNINTQKLHWSTSLVYALNRNKVLDLGPGVDQFIPLISQPSIVKKGYAIGSFIVYQTDGLIRPGEDGPNALTPQQQKSVGGQKYKDQNGDGKITQSDDRVIINNQPNFTAGLTNNVRYHTPIGSFDLTVFLQTQVGGKLYNQNRAQLELGTGYTNASTALLNRYTETNTNTDVKAAYQDPAITISDRFIENATYLRLKNVSLGYTLPNSWISRIRASNVRIYLSLQNFKTWTNYTGYDPEVSVSGQALINKGIDNGVYPNSKTVLGGVSFTF
ncbi:SusC/RagA family TonB-linked outer membrane protein [Ohtaekwangia sp.]|uniref:SusC/RagA family TonB-linked outer membrane protein n=1 Tax=Ohtaekwangia sp. TaxID=2066019 RepID=UPI002FDE05AC